MATFTATFSNGTTDTTITRTSEKEYITAAAWINIKTGEIVGETFSTKPNPNAASTYFGNVSRAPSYSQKDRARMKAKKAAAMRVWRHQVVSVIDDPADRGARRNS